MSANHKIYVRNNYALSIYGGQTCDGKDDDYSLRVNLEVKDAETSADIDISLGHGLSSKEIIGVAISMIEAAMPSDDVISDKIHAAIEAIHFALLEQI